MVLSLHWSDPPPLHAPPALHPVARFHSQGSTPSIVRSPGSLFIHHHHQCLDSIGGLHHRQIHFFRHGNKSSCLLKRLQVSPDWIAGMMSIRLSTGCFQVDFWWEPPICHGRDRPHSKSLHHAIVAATLDACRVWLMQTHDLDIRISCIQYEPSNLLTLTPKWKLEVMPHIQCVQPR